MYRVYFIVFLLAHVLGDFYVQTNRIAEKKVKSLKWVLIHSLCYWGIMVLISLPMVSWKIIIGATVLAILHGMIDIVKFIYLLTIKKANKSTQIIDRNIFFMDQFLHIGCIIVVAYCLVKNNVLYNEVGILKDFFITVEMSPEKILSWLLAILIIHKPANIAISKLLVLYKPIDKKEDMKHDNNAGRLIGTIERIIILIFLAIGQYSAIGLVLTAKSIARYDRISKEKNFAEYYLMGTLMSTVIVIVVSFIL